MNTPQTPDYGEPWKMLSREVGDFTTHPTPHDVNNKQVCDPYRNGLVEDCQKRAERIIACVNACVGMADPAAEIEDMREAIKEAYALVNDVYLEADSYADGATDAEFYAKLSNNFAHQLKPAITKLQPFIKP